MSKIILSIPFLFALGKGFAFHTNAVPVFQRPDRLQNIQNGCTLNIKSDQQQVQSALLNGTASSTIRETSSISRQRREKGQSTLMIVCLSFRLWTSSPGTKS